MSKKVTILVIILIIFIGGYLLNSNQNKKAELREDLMTPDFMEESESSVTVSELIQGKWQSIQDPKFVRTFTSTTIADSYEGDLITSVGSWQVFSGEDPVGGFPGTANPDSNYVVLRFEHEALFFEIAELSASNLDLIYLDRGGVLSFKKIPELE